MAHEESLKAFAELMHMYRIDSSALSDEQLLQLYKVATEQYVKEPMSAERAEELTRANLRSRIIMTSQCEYSPVPPEDFPSLEELNEMSSDELQAVYERCVVPLMEALYGAPDDK